MKALNEPIWWCEQDHTRAFTCTNNNHVARIEYFCDPETNIKSGWAYSIDDGAFIVCGTLEKTREKALNAIEKLLNQEAPKCES